MNQIYDVIIVGAGPGGSSSAYYLARAGLKVLLLDKSNFPRDKTCGDGLSPRALGVLADMGLLDELLAIGCRASTIDFIAPKGHSVATTMPTKQGWPDYSLIVPRFLLDNMVMQRAVATGAHFQDGVRVTNLVTDNSGVEVVGEKDNRPLSFRGRLAIIATGASASLLLNLDLLKRPPKMLLAGRTYFEQVSGSVDQDRVKIHFNRVALPGYGWAFPLAGGGMNVGVFYQPQRHSHQKQAFTTQSAVKDFINTPALQSYLAGARQVGAIRGYPLRTDFATSPTYGKRVLLVGEAAGLVNSLTGEGIDNALESGKIAGEYLVEMFKAGDLSQARLAGYDGLLRQRFQLQFLLCDGMHFLSRYPLYLNLVVSAALRYPHLKMKTINLLLGSHQARQNWTHPTLQADRTEFGVN